jgi:hypothetical protein
MRFNRFSMASIPCNRSRRRPKVGPHLLPGSNLRPAWVRSLGKVRGQPVPRTSTNHAQPEGRPTTENVCDKSYGLVALLLTRVCSKVDLKGWIIIFRVPRKPWVPSLPGQISLRPHAAPVGDLYCFLRPRKNPVAIPAAATTKNNEPLPIPPETVL